MARKDINSSAKKGQENGKKRNTSMKKDVFYLINSLKTEHDCMEFIKKVLYPNGVMSPYTWQKVDHPVFSSKHLVDYKCLTTGNTFSLLRGTIFSGSNLPLRTWLFVIYDLAASRHGLTVPEVMGKYGLSGLTAWRMIEKLQLCISQSFHNLKLSGLVDVDEKYYGGREKNRSYDKKLANPYRDGKIPVIGFAEKGGMETHKGDSSDLRRVRMVALDPQNYPGGANERTIRELTGKYTTDHCMYFTDSSRLYDWMKDREDMLHRCSSHANGNYSQNGEDSNTIEGYFGWVFPLITGVYRSPARLRLQLYLDTVCFLSNTRDMTVYERFLMILKYTRLNKAMIQKPVKAFWKDGEGNPIQGRPVELVNKRHFRTAA